jgi:peptide/nickel transport system substrate-binding protein
MDSDGFTQMLLNRRGISRRSMVKLLGGAASLPVISSLIVACGGGSSSPTEATNSNNIAATSVIGNSTASSAVQSGGTPTTASSSSASPVATSGSASSGTPKKGGTINMSQINDPDTLDPATAASIGASTIFQYIYDSLVFIGEDHLPHPWLAEKWDLSPDGLQVTFSIRSGIKFHDGTDLDGAAVKANFDRMLDPKIASIRKTGLGPLTGIDLVDPQTVRFNYSTAYAPLFTNLEGDGIVSPAAVTKYGDSYGHNPVGTGPFMFKEWATGQHVTLIKNPNFTQYRDDYKNKGPAYVDQLVWKNIADPATNNAALLSGELDIAGVDLTQASTVQKNAEFKVYIWKDRDGFIFLEYNPNKPPFNDVNVRKAMAYACDRDSIVKSAYNGFATANLLPIPTGVAGWDKSLEQYAYPYDLDKAKKALTDAGYTAGSNGTMQKDGKPFEFTMLVYSGNDPLKISAQIVQSSLQQIGVKCDTKILDFSAELPQLNSGDFECDIMRWTSPDANILSLMFKSPGWTKQWHDTQLDALCTTADTTIDPNKRLDAIHDVVKYLLDQAVVAPIVTDWSLWAVHQYVKDYSLTVFGNGRLADVWLDK